MIKNIIKPAGCLFTSFCFLIIALVGFYLFFMPRTNILILGIDAREAEGTSGRTDTMMVVSVDYPKPSIGILSIPRDLWVEIPGYGENRINTAHFFAENQVTGSGPMAAIEVVEHNFDIEIGYYARVEFLQFIELIDALGGVEITLSNPMSGLPAGEHQLSGEQALIFTRDRSGSDDFFRMERGQLLLKSLLLKLIKSENWKYLPQFAEILRDSIDTNIPLSLYPRLGIAILRTNPDKINFRIISREMVTPFTTEGGAMVLAPNWELIRPIMSDLFGK